MIDIRQHFLEFLLEHNALDVYISNKDTSTGVPKTTLAGESIISDSFTWKHSLEGQDYWSNLHILYQNFVIDIPFEAYNLTEVMEYCETYKASIGDSYEYW